MTKARFKVKFFEYFGLVMISIFLSSCASNNMSVNNEFRKKNNLLPNNMMKVLENISNTDTKKTIKQGILALSKRKYEEASEFFKEGLRQDPRNSNLHFLNAMSFHLRSIEGNAKMLALAESGYTISLKFDNANFWSSYFLGQIYFEQRKYKKAQDEFSRGLLYSPNNTSLLKALAVVSYYNKDIDLNLWASKKAHALDSEDSDNLKILSLSHAASGNYYEAKKALEEYNDFHNNKEKNLFKDILSTRVHQWNEYHQSNIKHISYKKDEDEFTKNFLETDENNYSTSEDKLNNLAVNKKEQNNSSKGVKNNTKEENIIETQNLPKMVLVDVLILRTEESRSESKGLNLLDALDVTLSGDIFTYTDQKGVGVTNGHMRSSTISVGLGAISYNLNIFNDADNKAEVLARPSLLAVENEESSFTSGAVLHVKVDGDEDGSLDEIPVGITLSVTPTFYKNDYLKIKVHASRSFLEVVSSKVTYKELSQTSNTSVDATAVLRFGETLILSGLTEREDNNSKSGVPLLQSIPGVQYLFSKEQETQSKKSIVVMLTPRRPLSANEAMTYDEMSKKMKEEDENLLNTKALINKESIISSNIKATMRHLDSNKFHRQFRLGDLKLDSWHDDDTIAGAIKRVLGFLYY